MKFLHTADLHLDSPLVGLSAYPDAPAQRLRTATRDAFQNLVTLAIDERVDFLVIAGDVYDGDWRDFNTGLFFVRQMGRLRAAGIPVYLLFGNHDADSEMTRRLELPDNVHTFSSRKVETFRIEPLKVALHGRSFRTAATTENLLPGYPPPLPGWLNIGVLHTGLEGNSEHARYAPCSIAELQATGYQYWALGHVHQQWIDRGATTIAYPGNLQGRHVREPGARSALLVSADGTEILDVEPVEADVLRWAVLEVDVGAATELRGAVRTVGDAMARLLEATKPGMPLAVRVVLTGRSEAHATLVADTTQLRQEVIAQAVALDAERLWVEKVRIETAPPEAPGGGATSAEAQGAIAELAQMARAAAADPDFVKSLQDDWAALFEKTPHDALQTAPALAALRRGDAEAVTARLDEAIDLLVARVGQDPRAGA